MKIEVAPYTMSPFCNMSGNRLEEGERRAEGSNNAVSCWGVYVNGKCVFFTSSRESAEKMKVLMEKHLNEEHQNLGQMKE